LQGKNWHGGWSFKQAVGACVASFPQKREFPFVAPVPRVETGMASRSLMRAAKNHNPPVTSPLPNKKGRDGSRPFEFSIFNFRLST
jgi:hypothetical protein